MALVTPDTANAIADSIVRSWTAPFWPTLGLLITAALYARGWGAARGTRAAELPAWRAACFYAGLASAWLAIASPLDALGGVLLLAHMVQHLVLMSVAPPLLILGAPLVPLLRGLPRAWVRSFVGPLSIAPGITTLRCIVGHPATAWLAMNIAYLGWHVPAAYELALRSPAWHEVEHACFLLTSLLFWHVVLEPWPAHSHWSRWAAIPYLVSADIVNTALSAFLVFSGRVLYPTYAAAPRVSGLSAAQDQAAAGAFMWVVGSAIYWVPAIGITLALLSRKPQSRTAAAHASHGLVTIGGAFAPGTASAARASSEFDLLRLPLLGPLLRARYGRQTLQAISLGVITLIIIDGLFGHPMAAMNLAGVVPWNIVRALAVLALLFVGNLFCMACPFTLPRELARLLGGGRVRWPARLRSKWIAVGLMVIFFYCYERFALWNSPALTAWLLLGYLGAAFLVDATFRGASFCKYVCPIGQFNFAASLISPTTLRVRSESVCSTCHTRDCIRGNQQQRGCELNLYLPTKRSNADCTLCMDCVKACPHDNIGILPRAQTAELLSTQPTASLGRLPRRPDLALAVLVVVFAAFANAATMVAPGAELLAGLAHRAPWLASTFGSFMAVLVVTLAATSLVWLASIPLRILQRASAREAFGRAAMALLPLGLAMWAAHLIFHLAMAAPAVPSLLAQSVEDLHLAAVVPHWQAPAMSSADTLLELQLLLLGIGLIVTVSVAWKGFARSGGGLSHRVVAVAPVLAVAIALYAIGFWLLLQPMQMRGVAMGPM